MYMMIATLATSSGDALMEAQQPDPAASSGTEPRASASGLPSGSTVLDQTTLTGDWFGAREVLSDRGLAFNVSLSQFYQGVVDGGKKRDFEYGGKLDYYVNFDGGKAGLWPGFSITTHVETRYGHAINDITGTFSIGNFNMSFPNGEKDDTGVTALKLTQRLFDHVMLIGGKINSLDDFRVNFTGRNGLDRFMNSAVVANIINARTIPYSTYGAGFAVSADQGPEFTFLVRDPDNHPNTADLDNLFAHGTLLTASTRLRVTPMGLPGTQIVGGNWSSRRYSSLDPSSWVNVPGQGIVAAEKTDSWAVYYNFDQYLWIGSANTNAWVGMFGMSGLSDGNPNPVHWNASIGLGCGGLIPGRVHDTFGVGYFYLGISEDFERLLGASFAPPGLAQRDEQGVELYYNAELAPWCHLTTDLQIISASTKNVGNTVLAGGRLKMDF